MNKRLTNQNAGQKKPPHHVGEDRDGVYGKENRVYYWERELLSFNDELFCHCVTSRNCSIRC